MSMRGQTSIVNTILYRVVLYRISNIMYANFVATNQNACGIVTVW